MIKRCLLVLFVHMTVLQRCRAIQYAPVDVADQTECALVLDSSTRSNLYDYGLNLLRGSFGFGNGQTCITYDAVNQAYIQARKRIHVAQPQGDWKAEDVATVGELLLEISTQLAKTYGLSVDDIEKGLPLIDTSKTLIQEVCPPYLSNVECHPGKYRRHDGLCNNLNNPTWGAINTPFTRLVPPQFADGMNAPRSGVLGNPLPIPRIVSRTMHPDEGYHDHAGTVMVVAWGQFMDHDFTLTATPLDARNKNDPEECCNRPPHQKHPYCLEIIIPEDDYFYHKYNVKCHDFVRSFPSARPGCRLGSKTPYNTLTGVIDGNTVYGVTEEFSRHLRSGYLGQLRMNPVFSEYGLKDLLPLKLDIPDEGCTRSNSSQYCFEAGEIRVNEQLVLTCMHTLMAREHNRLAGELAKINPHWDDETLYQEARRIVIAEIQHITYNEFLPIILGKEVMEKFGIILQKEGYWDGYDTQINPNIIDAFSAAAFRFGHSLLPTAVERWSKAHKFISSKRLSDLIRRPYDLYRAGVMDEYLMGLMNQVAQAMDDSITQEVTNHLLKKPGMRFGLDLVAFNMQRGREFGVPGYMEFRKFCGLPTATSFEEMFGSMPNSTVFRYMSIFEHPNDVDLWSGGVSERPLPGSMIGPTFACIIATQLSYARRGDRFWYELPNQPSTFSPEQLQEIRKIKLSRIMCDNTDLLDTIQIYPMVLPDHEINPRVPCRSGIIPSIDLTKWAAYPDSAAPHAQFKSLNISNLPVQPSKDNNTSNNTHFLLFPPVQKNVVNSEINLQTLDGELTPKKVLAYLAVPSVFYIQLLRARLGRVKRDNSDNHWEKIRTLSTESKSSLDNSQIQRSQSEHMQHNINDSSKAINQTNVKYQTKPELKNRTSNINYEINTGYVNTSKVPKTENEDQELQQDSSHGKRFEQRRLYHTHPFQSKSSESVDEYKYDYIPTTTYDEGEKRGADYSLFDNPVYNDYDDFYDTEEKEKEEVGEEEEEKKLEIIDVHDEHDLDYEYVPLNGSTNREPTEEINENEHTNNSPEYIVNDKENSNFKSNSENDKSVKYHNPFYDSLFKSEFVEQLFPQSVTKTNDGYIKEPLAGPNATRGFGHDFKVQRGNKVKGNVGTQLPNRFPTVGYFNTKQVHKLLQQPQLVTNNTNGGTRLKNFTKTVVLQPVPSFDGSSDDHYGPRFESLEEYSGYEDQPESIEDSPEYVDFDYDESVTKRKLRTRDNVRDYSNYPSRTQDEITSSNDEFQRGEFSIKKPLLIRSKTNNENNRNIPKFSENGLRTPTIKEQVDIHKQQNKYRSNPKLVSNIDNERPNLYIVYPSNGKILNTEIQSKDTINNPSIPKKIYKSTETDEYEDGSDEEDETHKIFKNDNESENSEKKAVEEEEHKEAARDEEDNVEEEEKDTGIYRTISKILEGKDQISREKNILKGPKPQVYNNYWTLEYSFPKKK